MKKLLIVKTGSAIDLVRQKYGDFEDLIINGAGIEQDLVEVFDAKDETLTFPLPDQYAGIIITGSHDMMTFADDWMLDLKEWITTIPGTGIPTLGICFGHQAMAEAFGGKVDYRDWGPEVGYVKVKFEAETQKDKLFGFMHDKAMVYQYHSQSVVGFPEKAFLLGSNNIDFYQVMRYNDYMWSCQFHPEFTEDVLKEYIQHNALHLTSEGLDPYELLTRLQPDETGSLLLKRFINICGLN
jgi:GMP synthase (glutamine-hydrolysing)